MNQNAQETSPGRRLLLIAACIVLWILGTLCVIYWTGWLSLPHPAKHASGGASDAQVMMRYAQEGPCGQLAEKSSRDSSARQARAA